MKVDSGNDTKTGDIIHFEELGYLSPNEGCR